MSENHHAHFKLYAFFQSLVYFFIGADVYTQCLGWQFHNAFADSFNMVLYRLPFLYNPVISHLTLFGVILVVALASQSKKDIEFHAYKHFVYPFAIGLFFFITSIFLLQMENPNTRLAAYGLAYLIGSLILHTSLGALTKIIFAGLKKDIWNTQEESFPQNTKLVKADYLFNLPIKFFYKKKIHQGWMNINVFRAIMVIGVPGSGKTESVIIPFIKQLLARGFSMLVYDFKYPDLAKITYYHYLLHKHKTLKQHSFHVINLDNVEYSRRINPLHADYIQNLADAAETADAIISALTKSDKHSGSAQFFDASAKNFLSACIYFFATHEGGRYSTLPHVMAFISLPYDKIFATLFAREELQMLLAPFKSAYDNRAFDQLEGQIGTVRINISKIATKESFWVFSGNDFDLKISNPPSILVLANSPDTQSINSAFFSAVLMRTIRLVNSKGNNPCAIVVDETPTVFLHKVENLIATARSNKVSVVLGLQEIPQFFMQYGKDVANTITAIMGTVLSGAVNSRESLDWLEKLFGKIKQVSSGVSIDRNKTNLSINERLDHVIPASRIANLNAGEMVGKVARENDGGFGEYAPNIFNCKIDIDMQAVQREKEKYPDLPQFYTFGTLEQKNKLLMDNLVKIKREVENLKV